MTAVTSPAASHWKTPLYILLALCLGLTLPLLAAGPAQVVVKQGIADVNVSYSADSATVIIRGDTPLHYTFSRRANPNRVVLVFDGASVAAPLLQDNPFLVPEPAPIKKVELYASSANSRAVLAVFLRRATRTSHVLRDDRRTLVLAFGDAARPSFLRALPARPAAKAKPAANRAKPQGAPQIAAITVQPGQEKTDITVEASGKIGFRPLRAPERQIAVAITGAQLDAHCPTTVPVETNGVKRVRLVPEHERAVKLLVDLDQPLEATTRLSDTGAALHIAVQAPPKPVPPALDDIERKLFSAPPVVLGPIESRLGQLPMLAGPLTVLAAEEPSDAAPQVSPAAELLPGAQPLPKRLPAGKGISVLAQTAPATIPPPTRPGQPNVEPEKPQLGYIGLDFKNTPLADALQALAYYADANIIVDGDVKGTVTMTLSGVQVEEALTVICALYDLDWAKIGDTYLVGAADKIAAVWTRQKENVYAVYAAMTQELDSLVSLMQSIYRRVSFTPQKDTNRIILVGPKDDVDNALSTLVQIDGGRAVRGKPAAAVPEGPPLISRQEIIDLWPGADASEIETLLTDFIGKDLKVKVRPAQRQIIIQGPPYLMEQAKQFLANLEQHQPKWASTAYSPVNQPAATIKSAIQARFPNLTVEISEDQKTLTIAGPEEDVAEAQKIATLVDVPSRPEATATYTATTLDPNFLAQILNEDLPAVSVEVQPAQKTLTVSGSRDDVRSAIALLRRWDAQSVTETITLQYVDSRYLIPTIAKRLPEIQLTGAANILMLQGAPQDVRQALRLVSQLDTVTARELMAKQIVQRIVELDFVEPSTVSKYLTQLYGTTGGGAGAAAPGAAPTAPAAPSAAPTAPTAPTGPPTPPGGFGGTPPAGASTGSAPTAAAVPVAAAGAAAEQTGLTFFVDEETHKVIINGPRLEVEQAVAKIEELDTPPHQVTIQAIITDINREEAHNHGIEWSWGFTRFVEGGTTGTAFHPGIKIGSIAHASLDIMALFNWLNTAQYSRLLANPKVKAIDGKKAMIHVGDELRYPVLQTGVGGGAPTFSTESVDVGIILEFTPRISSDGWITVELKAESSTVTGFQNSLPQISRRTAETTVRLRDGETMVLGGLIRDSEIEVIKRVPILHKIPFFGRLFKNRSVTRTPQELLVFITPRIEYAEPAHLSSLEEDIF